MNLEVAPRSSAVGYGGAPFAVLLLSLGGPRSSSEVRPYLEQRLLDHEPFSVGFILRAPLTRCNLWIQARQLRRRLMRLPVPVDDSFMQRAATAIEKRLRLRGRDATVRSARRFLEPAVEPTLVELHSQGLRRMIVVLLHPQTSQSITAMIHKEYRRAISQSGCLFRTSTVESWYADNGYLDLMAQRLQQSLEEYAAEERDEVRVLFSAEGVLDSGRSEDLHYVEQVDATIQGIVARLPRGIRWRLGYHSGPGPQRWLLPDVETALHGLAEQGGRHVLCMPLAVQESLESRHDLDVLMPEVATRLGFESVQRIPALEDHAAFLDLLSQWIVRRLTGEQEGGT